jgi:hypothetical protein
MSPASWLKWLKGIRSATVALWIYFFVLAALPLDHARGSGPAVSSYSFALLICAWTLCDARERKENLCYDFDSFLLFAWPIAIPTYLFRTRG